MQLLALLLALVAAVAAVAPPHRLLSMRFPANSHAERIQRMLRDEMRAERRGLRALSGTQVLFVGTLINGDIGNRSVASAMCGTAYCDDPISILNYADDSVLDLSATLTQGAQLMSVLALPLGDNGTWSLFDGTAEVAMANIAAMVGTIPNIIHWHLGTNPDGSPAANCVDFTSSSPSDTGVEWPTGDVYTCDNLKPPPCICDFASRRRALEVLLEVHVGGPPPGRTLSTTNAPTHKPTALPTARPTTRPTTHAPSTGSPTLSNANQIAQTQLLDRAATYQSQANYLTRLTTLPIDELTATTINAAASQALATSLVDQANAI